MCKEYVVTDSILLANTPRGYRRSDELQDEFLAAAETLRRLDGWPNPNNGGERELRADLALELSFRTCDTPFTSPNLQPAQH